MTNDGKSEEAIAAFEELDGCNDTPDKREICIKNINGYTAISSGAFHTVGLKSNGTVVAVGVNNKGQCNVSDWNHIIAVSAGNEHTVALKSDGTVVAVGSNSDSQCDVSGW